MVETILTAHTDNRNISVCPICYGTGYVDAGYYNMTGTTWTSIGGTELCRSCNGNGYVVV